VSVYERDPGSRPDEDYEPGTLRHVAAGARGRMLDPRRTPISVLEVQPEVGFVLIRVEAFEDAGATWQIPLERFDHYQFEPGGPSASDATVAEMGRAIDRFARDEEISADAAARTRTEADVAARQADAHRWLTKRSRFLAQGMVLPEPSTRRGDPLLQADLERYLRDRGLWAMEDRLTRSFVSNPGAGELVKGHRMVLAELGLAGYTGPIVRDPATFEGDWSRQARARHIVERLAFVRTLFGLLGHTHVPLWRGLGVEGRRDPHPARTFVSTSFDEAVARSHYESYGPARTGFLVVREVPVERLFMTYLETAAMNTVFLEAEAVVLDHPDDRWP
jgi:hypothetical protein